MDGRVLEIHIAPGAGEETRCVPGVEAVAGRGLAGDRYASRTGSRSASQGARDVTLIEIEAFWELFGSTGINLYPGMMRRNIVTEGVRLESLIGREFTIGPVRLLGLRTCPPCHRLVQKLGMPCLLKEMARSGGIYAKILEGGPLRVGDAIVPLD